MPGLLAQLPDPAQMQAVRDGVSQQSQTLASITTTLGTMPIGDIRALAEASPAGNGGPATALGEGYPRRAYSLQGHTDGPCSPEYVPTSRDSPRGRCSVRGGGLLRSRPG